MEEAVVHINKNLHSFILIQMADRPLPLSLLAITHEARQSIEVDFQMNITTWQSVISTDIKSHVLGGFPSRGPAAIRILMFHAYWTDINQLRFPHHVESLSAHNPHIMAFWFLRPPTLCCSINLSWHIHQSPEEESSERPSMDWSEQYHQQTHHVAFICICTCTLLVPFSCFPKPKVRCIGTSLRCRCRCR